MNVLVTGATDGIGRETAAELARRGARVVVHGRDAEKVARASREIPGSAGVTRDLASLAEVRRLAEDVLALAPRLDVLVNNAGVFMQRRVLTVDGFETTFAVNHLAPFLLTHLLLGALEASGAGRVVVVSSMAHASARIDWHDLNGERRWDGYDAYARSKLANVLFARELARRLGARPVAVNALHPGVVATKLLRAGFGAMRGSETLAEGAATSVYLATSPEVAGKTGGYFVRCAPARPSSEAQDDAVARRLFEVSAKMVGLEA